MTCGLYEARCCSEKTFLIEIVYDGKLFIVIAENKVMNFWWNVIPKKKKFGIFLLRNTRTDCFHIQADVIEFDRLVLAMRWSNCIVLCILIRHAVINLSTDMSTVRVQRILRVLSLQIYKKVYKFTRKLSLVHMKICIPTRTINTHTLFEIECIIVRPASGRYIRSQLSVANIQTHRHEHISKTRIQWAQQQQQQFCTSSFGRS